MDRSALAFASLSLCIACGGTTSSTIPTSEPTRGLSENETSALSVLPEEILVLSTFDVARLRDEPLTEPQVVLLEAAVPFAHHVRRMHVAIGDFGPLERLCLDGPLTPKSGGCPEAPIQDANDPRFSYEASLDEADALASVRQGPERQSFAFYVVFEATPEACASLVGEATASNGRRVRTESGVGLVDLGEGVCVFTSASLVDRVRPRGDRVVAAAANARARSAPSLPSAFVELTLAPERVEPFYESWAATGANFVPRVDIALRSRLRGLRTLSLSAATRSESYGLGISLRYELGEQPIGTEALPRLVQDVYEAIRSSSPSRDESGSWIRNMRIDRSEHELALDIPFDGEDMRDFLQDALRTMSRSTSVDIPSETDGRPNVEAQRVLAELATAMEAMTPDEALLAIERAAASDASGDADVARMLAMRRVFFLYLTGRFEDAKGALAGLLQDGLCSSGAVNGGVVPYEESEGLIRVMRLVAVGSDALRHDVETFALTTESLADPATSLECLTVRVLRDAAERLLLAFQGRVDATDPAPAPTSARASFDRFPTTSFTVLDSRFFALARLGRFADIRSIVQHARALDPGIRERSMRYYGALAAIETGHALDVLTGPSALDLDRSQEYADEYSPDDTLNWVSERLARIEDADRAWLRCRAERRANGDRAAIAVCSEAVRSAQRAHGPVHPNVARVHLELAEALMAAGRRDEGRTQARGAVAALQYMHETHPLLVQARRLAR